MSKRRHQPTSQHQSTATQQADGPTTQDAGVAQAEQVGNGATQEEMQGQEEGQCEEGSDMESMPVEEWGLAQLDSVGAVLVFIDAVGTDKALRWILELGTELLLELLETIASKPEYVELFFVVAASVGKLPFLPDLPPGVSARLLSEAIQRGADWLLEQIATWAPEPLLVVAKHMDQQDLRDVLDAGDSLGNALLNAWWTPGLGLTVTAELEGAINSVVLGGGYTGTIRHTGAGAFELTVEVRGKVGGEVGEGGSGGGAGAEAMFIIEGEGMVKGTSTRMLASLYAGALLGAAGWMQGGFAGNLVAAGLTQAIPWADVLDTFEVEGKVSVGGEAKAKGSEVMKGVLSAAVGVGGNATFENLEGQGRDFERGDVTVSVGAEVAGELTIPGGKVGKALKLVIPEPGEVGVGAKVAVHFDFDTSRDRLFSEPTYELIAEGKGLGAETSLGMEVSQPESTDIDALIDSLEGLHFSSKVSLEVPIAKKAVPAEYLPDFLEAEGIIVDEGELEVTADVGREGIQELARMLVDGLEEASDPKKACEEVLSWARNPLGRSSSLLLTLLCQEVAASSTLKATVRAGYTFKTERAAEVAAGTKWGAAAEVGGTLDVQRDVLQEGAHITFQTIQQLIDQTAGETEALAAK